MSVWRPLQTFRSFRIQFGQALAVELSYRLAFVQNMATELFGMLGVLMFWLAVARTSGGESIRNHGYSPALLIGYFVVATAMGILCDDGMSRSLSFDIRMGRLSSSLVRPHPFVFSVVARALAFISVRTFVVLPVGLVTCYLIPDLRTHLLAMTWQHWILFIEAVALGLMCGWAVKSTVGFLAFRLTQTWGPELIYLSVFALASGERFPPDVLPAWVLGVISWTPVYYMVGFPSMVFLGRIPSAEMAQAFAQGALVLVVSVVCAQGLWRLGLKRFEAVGI